MTSLKSSVEQQGATVTQIVCFTKGYFCKFKTTDDRMVMVHTRNVNWVEIIKET